MFFNLQIEKINIFGRFCFFLCCFSMVDFEIQFYKNFQDLSWN